MKTILMVSMAPGDALRAARELGLRVALLSDAELSWQRQYVHDQITVSPYDPEGVLTAVAQYTSKNLIHGIVTFDERAVPIAGLLADKLNLRGNSAKASYAARNKFVMRTQLSLHGLRCPRFGVAWNPDQAQ